jgi:phage baseplate assembly protein W
MSLTGNQTRKSYSFKSVGIQTKDPETIVPRAQKLPIGIKTPIQLGTDAGGLFVMHKDIDKQLSDNLRNLILTNHGERLGFYDFGANLRELTFDLGTDSADKEAISRIKRTTNKYMPFISLEGFQVFVDREDNKSVAKVGIQVTYTIPRLDTALRSLEVMLFMGG